MLSPAPAMVFAALDVGDARIGVAVSDDLGMLVRGVGVVERRGGIGDLEAIARLLRSHGVDRLVIGLPLDMHGGEGRQAERVRAFGERVRLHTGLDVVYWDERLSSFEAEDRLRRTGLTAKRRRRLVDQVAAEVILRSYLDGRP